MMHLKAHSDIITQGDFNGAPRFDQIPESCVQIWRNHKEGYYPHLSKLVEKMISIQYT